MDKEKSSNCNCYCPTHNCNRSSDAESAAFYSNVTENLTPCTKVQKNVSSLVNQWENGAPRVNQNIPVSNLNKSFGNKFQKTEIHQQLSKQQTFTDTLPNVSLKSVTKENTSSKSFEGNFNKCQENSSYYTAAQSCVQKNNQVKKSFSRVAETSNISSKPQFSKPTQKLVNLPAHVDKLESKSYLSSGYQYTKEGLTKLFEKINLTSTKPNKLPEYNILLLGGTGTGKSTTINAYANYVKFSSFDEARQQQNFVELISSSFKLSHPDMDEEFCVQSGFVDPNESNLDDYKSRTQHPMAYNFTFKDKIIRLIDSPGAGDTGGLDVDRQNFENILEYLKSYQTLHGIIILVKANETRNMTAFNYCITELFKRLHRSASENVFFCFTFSRTTFYHAGDGLKMLNELLKEEFPDSNLTLKPRVNCFFIDNEAYRYLVAKKAGYPFEDYQLETFAEAWNNSAANTEQMLLRITEKVPHNLQATFKLNMAQKFIAELADPIVQLQKQIYVNIKMIKQQKESIESGCSSIDYLCQTMNKTVDMVEYVRLPVPITVCGSKMCNLGFTFDGYQVENYSLCCDNCPVQYVEHSKKGEKLLKNCKIFFNQNGVPSKKCIKCSCAWKDHMQVDALNVKVQHQMIDQTKRRELDELMNSKQSSDFISKKIIFALVGICEEYQNEISTIQDVAACFGYLLNKHSNSSVNQFIEPYLELLIEKEQVKMESVKDYLDDVCRMLQNLKNVQCDYVKYIEELVVTGKLNLQLENIGEIANRLCYLKHYGPLFKKLIEQFLKKNVKEVNHVERDGVSKLENFLSSMTTFQK